MLPKLFLAFKITYSNYANLAQKTEKIINNSMNLTKPLLKF